MGLTIHYNGKFSENAFLTEMIEEVKDIAEIYNWKYTIFEMEFPSSDSDQNNQNGKLYGIMFFPPESEPVSLSFLSNRRMCSLVNLKVWGNSSDEKAKEYLYLLSTKTQFAGISIHKMIIHILRHISKKYLKDFSLYDEGKYWETGDEQLLQQIFSRYEAAFDIFEGALDNNPKSENESFEEYFERLLKKIQTQRKNDLNS
ncbi:MAG: hypothetical protein MUO34_02135 [Ignavibacteriaceae bacterium]|nr:hypothetical protein [Ignavibacteriaceae bacterium]